MTKEDEAKMVVTKKDIAEIVDKTVKKTVLEGLTEGFIYQPADYYPKQLIATYNGNLKHGDKVKLIIIREEEDENKDS